ncbi:MAG: 1-deoxy-D-xylulose-5-phosphate reductoisomerase [Acidimicrobiales bacterium]
MKRVSLVGSTGSIGTQALEVIRSAPQSYRVVALGAATSVDALAAQAAEFHPEAVAVADPARAAELSARVPAGVEVVAGPEALAEVATMGDVVVNGVVGFAGLPVTLAALGAGLRLALANKESLIAAGPVVQRARRTRGAEIVPVDSEHCAIHQCLRAVVDGSAMASLPELTGSPLRRIVLTASGGPFRGRRPAELSTVTVDEALAHPTWKMGPKITVDSSTLMNKGLEVIEAHELFGVGYDRIEVVVHPQSVVHSMVETTDGATLAQLSMPDMRLPIGYALAYPDRLATPFGAIDWRHLGRLDFEAPDLDAFACLGLAYEAGRLGGTAPAVLNAANEVAVGAFLKGMLAWVDIPSVIEEVLSAGDLGDPAGVDDVLAADMQARRAAGVAVARRGAGPAGARRGASLAGARPGLAGTGAIGRAPGTGTVPG